MPELIQNNGINCTPFVKKPDVKFENNFLYYGSSQLTDQYYIKHCHIYNNGLFNSGIHKVFCIGPIKKGAYVCTCPFYGVAMQGANSETAFAQSLEDKYDYEVGLIDVIFL